MAYVPGFKYDLYLSFAHVDDTPVTGTDRGWVSLFQRNLFLLLDRRLGRRENYAPFNGHQFVGNAELEDLLQVVRESATLVVIVSPSWTESAYCQNELKAFLDRADRNRSRDIFIVEMLPITNRPKNLPNNREYCFWYEDERGRTHTYGYFDYKDPPIEYGKRLDNLAQELADHLISLREDAAALPRDPAPLAVPAPLPSAAIPLQELPKIPTVTDPPSSLAGQIESRSIESGRHVFVSFCNHDEEAAVQIVADLERAGFPCWIANRDVWQSYQREIAEAIKSAGSMVLMCSADAYGSEEMAKELALASRYKVPRVPVRLDGTEASGDFEYELANNQYVDLFVNREANLQRLLARLTRLRAARPH